MNCILLMVITLFLSEQWHDSLTRFVRIVKKLKMKQGLVHLLLKDYLEIPNRFAFLSMMILANKKRTFVDAIVTS